MNPQNNAFNANYKTENGLLEILPKSPIETSQYLAWDGIEVQSHHQPAAEMPEYISGQHLISIHHLQSPLSCERFIDGQRKDEYIWDEQVVIIPASSSHKAQWGNSVSATVLVIDPKRLVHVAHESVNIEKVELQPTFSQHDKVIHHIGSLLAMELNSKVPSSKLYIDGLTTALCAHLLRQYCTIKPLLQSHEDGLPPYMLQQAVEYIQSHLAGDVSLNAIATELGISQYYFCRLFKQSVGQTPHAYVIQQRIERSKRLLKQQGITINDISVDCGFANPSHFARCFRRATGLSPKQFRML